MARFTLLVPLLLAAAPLAAQYEGAADLRVLGLDSTRSADAVYLGDQACRPCHEAAYQTWLGTAHARSWVLLGLPEALAVARRESLRVEAPVGMAPEAVPQRTALCLSCHAAAADVEPARRAPAFRLQEGVQCEGCHGPGAMHVAPGLVLAGQRLRASRMEIPDEAACKACHAPLRASHEILERPVFDYPAAQARIAHPMTGAQRRRLLREQPGAYLSIGLRTMLGHLFGS